MKSQKMHVMALSKLKRRSRSRLSILLLTLLLSCGKANEEEALLMERFHQYEKAWTTQQYGEVWALMSDRLKRGNDDSLPSFVEHFERFDVTIKSMDVLETRLHDGSATILVKVGFEFNETREIGFEIQEERWVNERGDMVFR